MQMNLLLVLTRLYRYNDDDDVIYYSDGHLGKKLR